MIGKRLSQRTVCVVCAVVLLTAGFVAGEEGTVVVRVFRLQYVNPASVSSAVQPLLSDNGTVTVQPSKRLVTVRDQADIVDRVGRVIARLDVEPQSFRLRVELLAGYNEEISLPEVVSVDPRIKRMFPFGAYRRLGVAFLEGATGDDVAVDLREGYRVRVKVRDHRMEDLPYGLPEKSLRLSLQPLVLDRIRQGTIEELLKTKIVLSVNQEVFIGAGDAEGSERGLVIIVKALGEGAR